MEQRYMVAGIDVHKAMLAVVVAEVKPGEWEFQRRRFGTTRSQLQELAEWLRMEGVVEVVMESTAQYWRPVWLELEGEFELQLAQARSNGARRGRKSDFRDAERLVRRLVAGDLVVSYVPDQEQRGWRWLTRTRYELVCERKRVQSQIEWVLEDGQIKLSSVITDLLGVSGRRILAAMAQDGPAPLDARRLAELGDRNLRASREELEDALTGQWQPTHRLLLRLHLERLQLLDQQIEVLYRQMGEAMKAHEEAVARLCEIPGVGPDAAMQIIAEVGPAAEAFPSAGQLASWVGVCPGQQESAGVCSSEQSAKGNRTMRRLLNQASHGAVHKKGSFLQALYRRLLPRTGSPKATWAVAHRLCRLIWVILHNGVRYVERGPGIPDPKLTRRKIRRLSAEFQRLGFHVQLTPIEVIHA